MPPTAVKSAIDHRPATESTATPRGSLARTTWSLTVTVVATVVGAILSILTAPFVPALTDRVIRLWARTVLAGAAIAVRCRGLEHLPRDRGYVLVANHQSNFDTPLLCARLPGRVRFVAKRELFRIPVFGAGLRAIGTIPVERSGGGRDRQAIETAARRLGDRVSYVLFGEGTRGDGERVRPFRKGAARLAISSGVPLVPAAIAGTRHAHPKGGDRIRGGQTVALVVGPPIDPAGLDAESLTERAHAAVVALAAEAEALRSTAG